MKTSICLNMIVKNEASIITRCLASVRPLLSSWVIVDTGSTDGTQEVIRSFLADIPGELHERPWRNFGANRTEALQLAKDKAEFTLVMDADDELVIPAGWELPPLSQDMYFLLLTQRGHSMYRAQLLRSALPWRYEGVLHEVVTCGQKVRQAKLQDLSIRMHTDGARAADPEKYLKDAAVLVAALLEEPQNTRYAFYLAQSYRDANALDKSIDAYQKRAAMGGFAEEVWYSLFQVARLSEQSKRPRAEVIAAYLAAHESRPTRAESLCYLALYCRTQAQPASAYVFAKAAVEIPMPKDVLFLDNQVYACRARDELMMAAYAIGRLEEAGKLAQMLLEGGKLPQSERARVDKIRALCKKSNPQGGSMGGMSSCKE